MDLACTHAGVWPVNQGACSTCFAVLREENARLRQRVAELERELRLSIIDAANEIRRRSKTGRPRGPKSARPSAPSSRKGMTPMLAIGQMCGMREDEYPLRAVERLTRERDEARQQLTCIDLWLRRREPVTHESATLRSVQEFVATVERERDEARVTKDMHKERAQKAWAEWAELHDERDEWKSIAEYNRGVGKELQVALAEVARLEGLILDWGDYYETPMDESAEDVQLRGAVYELEAEARRIREARDGKA